MTAMPGAVSRQAQRSRAGMPSTNVAEPVTCPNGLVTRSHNATNNNADPEAHANLKTPSLTPSTSKPVYNKLAEDETHMDCKKHKDPANNSAERLSIVTSIMKDSETGCQA